MESKRILQRFSHTTIHRNYYDPINNIKLPTKIQSPVPRKHQNNNKFMHAYGSTPRLGEKNQHRQRNEGREKLFDMKRS